MGKEVKIGLSVIAVLLSVFLYLLFDRLSGRGATAPPIAKELPSQEAVDRATAEASSAKPSAPKLDDVMGGEDSSQPRSPVIASSASNQETWQASHTVEPTSASEDRYGEVSETETDAEPSRIDQADPYSETQQAADYGPPQYEMMPNQGQADPTDIAASQGYENTGAEPAPAQLHGVEPLPVEASQSGASMQDPFSAGDQGTSQYAQDDADDRYGSGQQGMPPTSDYDNTGSYSEAESYPAYGSGDSESGYRPRSMRRGSQVATDALPGQTDTYSPAPSSAGSGYGGTQYEPATDGGYPSNTSESGGAYATPGPRRLYDSTTNASTNGATDRFARPGGTYTVATGDNFWNISEMVYGDGAYFRALYEHNRRHVPKPEQLRAGEVIETPPVSVLAQTYPDLCPKSPSAVQPAQRLVRTGAQLRTAGGRRVYVVEQGDTLFDIAKYELGSAGRWQEIYQLNRERIGENVDQLRAGTELILPAGSPSVTEAPGGSQPAGFNRY